MKPMGVSKVVYGNTTLVDLTADTVTADAMLHGITATNARGEKITGTAGARVEGESIILDGTVTGETLEMGGYQWPILVASL